MPVYKYMMRQWINLVESAQEGVAKTVLAYHGTHADFEKFRQPKAVAFFDPSGTQRLGIWFTDSFDAAKKFALDGEHAAALDADDTAWVIEATLSFRKALVVHDWENGLHQAAGAVLEPYDYNQYEDAFTAFRKRLLTDGFDGIVVLNSDTDRAGKRTDFIVLKPAIIQIKGRQQIDEPYWYEDDDEDED